MTTASKDLAQMKDILYGNSSRLEGFWWNNHILFQHGKKWTNVAFQDGLLNLCKALRSKDERKWKPAMQKAYD